MELDTDRDYLKDGVICYKHARDISKQSLHEDLDETGILLLRDVNPDSSDQLLKLGDMLGTMDIGIEEELLGPALMHLRYDPAKAQKSNSPAYFTADFFPLHTDVSYVPNPPRFLLMHCVHSDPGGGGVNFLADCDKALAALPVTEQAVIRREIFSFLYPPNCREGQSKAYAIFGDDLWRYKHSSMQFPRQSRSAVELFNQALTDISIPLLLERGDLLIVDNHRIAHGRTAFNHVSPDLPGRHIMRLYANSVDSQTDSPASSRFI